ncbi:MAG: FTR1 family protein [Thermoflexales bacterium]|nr:FTR1 family protein [Thermoflexales bacterium]
MLASLLITLREGLEAALIVGIVLGVLHRLQRHDLVRPAWAGVAAAVALSVAGGLALRGLGVALEGRSEEIFEGATMLVAASVLTWMIFWMGRRGREIQATLERDVRRTAAQGSAWGLFGLTFIAVVREGVETALFLNAALFTSTPTQTLIGGVLGLAIAVGLGWAIFAAGRRLNIRAFFRVTGIFLLLFAAGLVARGVHEFQEAALLPTLVQPVWDLNPFLDEHSLLGEFLKALFGYNGDPSLLEILAYGLYLAAVGWISLRPGSQPVATHSSPSRG